MQRVAIARALIHQPAIILADEPTANLDEANADATLLLLLDLPLERQAVVIVTHDERIASRFDRIIRLEYGEIINEATQRIPSSRNP